MKTRMHFAHRIDMLDAAGETRVGHSPYHRQDRTKRMKWKNLRRLKLETLFDKIHECDADLERRHLAVRQGAPLKEERDYINEFIIPLETISTLPGEQTSG